MSRKRVVDEDVRFNIIINGDQGQKELYNLEKRQRELTSSNKALNAEKAKLVSQGKKNSAQYKNLSSEIKRNNVELTQNRSRMNVLQKQFGITSLTMAQLNQRASQLRMQLRHMIPGTAQHKKLSAELRVINTRLTELRVNSAAAQTSVHRLADSFTRFAVLGGTVIATITGMVLSIQRLLDFNGKLSDSQADVQKTTGMTKEEVDELTKSFGAFKTRTARMELLKLAEEAGRLGITGVQNLQDFVEQANKIKVALGDVLSDEAIKEVGKMTNIFKVGEETNRDFAESFESLGSAINDVSMQGANQADFLVDFLKRTAGVAASANISATAIIGMAAAFDEAGASRETSATAINKTLISMGQNTEKFAQIAGMAVQDFSKLLNEDANEALFAFLEGLSKGNPSLEELSSRLKGVEVGGARGVASILALTRNLDIMRKRQEQANTAMWENTSVADEYAIKNENLAATIEKIRKEMMGWFANENIVNGMTSFMHWFSKFIGASEDADGSVTRFRDKLVFFLKILLILTTAWISYNVALRLTVMWTNRAIILQKILNAIQSRTIIITNTLRTAKLLLSAAYFKLTGNTTRAAAAMRLFNATMLSNPLGAVLGLLAAVAAAIYLFRKNAKDATVEIKNLSSETQVLSRVNAELESNFAKSAANLKSKISPLIRILKDQNTHLETRKKAYKELIKISPDFIGTVNDEYIALDSLDNVYARLLDKMKQKLRAQANEKIMSGYYDDEATALEKVVKLERDIAILRDKELEYREKASKLEGKQRENVGLQARSALIQQIRMQAELDKARNELISASQNVTFAENWRDNEIKRLEEVLLTLKNGSQEYIDIQNQIFALLGTTSSLAIQYEDPGVFTTTPGATADTSKADELKKQQDELLKMQRDAEDKRLALIQDSFQREMAINDANHLRTVQDLETKADEIVQAYDKAIAAGNTEAASVLLDQYHSVYDMIETEEVHHQRRRNEILQTGIEAYTSRIEGQFKREQQQRQLAYNEEIEALGTNEEAKKLLRDKFNRENLERQKAHQQEVKNELLNIMETSKFEGFSLNLLSEEEKQKIIDRLKELGLSISEINVLLAQMQGKESSDALGDLGIGGSADILGFTPENWDTLFTNFATTQNMLESIVMGVMAMQQAYAMFSDFQNKKDQDRLRSLERNYSRQEQRQRDLLDRGYISQKQYDDSVRAMDEELEKKKEAIAKKQAKREKVMALASIATNTAQAIMGIWAQVPKFDFGISAGLLTGFVSALGLAQAAAVLSTKGYEQGFYNNSTIPVQREQDGKMFNASFGGQSRSGVVNKPTVFLAGEGGKNFPEMIIDGRTLKQFDPGLKESLYRELGRVKGFENGYYGAESSQTGTGDSQVVIQQNTAAMMQMVSLLEKLDRDGITALMDKDMRNIYKLRKELKRLEEYENKSKFNT